LLSWHRSAFAAHGAAFLYDAHCGAPPALRP
jgi:hypothetical protein